MTTVEIGDLTLQDTTTAGFGFNKLGDWYSLTSSKATVTERSQANGAFGIGVDWRQSAAISLAIYYVADPADPAGARVNVQRAKNTLKRAAGRGLPVIMAVTDQDGRFQRTVSVRSIQVDDDNGKDAFTATMDVVAEDPFMYGDQIDVDISQGGSGGGLLFPLGTTPTAYWDFGADGSNGRALITNDGTADVYPVVTFYGPAAEGFQIEDTTSGEIVQFSNPVNDGDRVQIDMSTGAAILDGAADVSAYITSFGYFSIPPGESHVVQFAVKGQADPSTHIRVSYRPAFL